LVFEGGKRRFCLDCFFFKNVLDEADVELLHRLMQLHDSKTMLKSWLMKGRVYCFGPGNRIDSEKAKAVVILKRGVFCREQMALVTAIDASCYAWRPREPAGAPAQEFFSKLGQ
jgi:hypothetical protein